MTEERSNGTLNGVLGTWLVRHSFSQSLHASVFLNNQGSFDAIMLRYFCCWVTIDLNFYVIVYGLSLAVAMARLLWAQYVLVNY